MSRTAKGFSGEGYEVWVEEPSERVTVVCARLRDHATAVLTLDDGRQLLVDLTGLREPGGNNEDGQAIVTMSLSDPEIASLGPDEIRARLGILPDIGWCAHWNQTPGRSRGGLTTKIHVVVDAIGQLIQGRLAEGQVHDVTQAPELLRCVPAKCVAADKAYDSQALRGLIASMGAKVVIPPRVNRREHIRWSKQSTVIATSSNAASAASSTTVE